MAFQNPRQQQQRILWPAVPVVDGAGNLFLPPPPPIPAGHVIQIPGPSYFVGGPPAPPLFVVGNQKGPAVGPFLAVNPAVWMQIDAKRNQSLIRFMGDEGLEPTAEEDAKRSDVINQLKQIVMTWIKKVAQLHGLPSDAIDSTSATIMPYGSYGLGVHGSESDIDALCIGPKFATMDKDFFIVLRDMLETRQEVSELHAVKSAKIPLMRLKYNGISVDITYAQLPLDSVPENVNIFDNSYRVEETSWRSLSGIRANIRILQLVPNLKNFQSLLRCIKLWAKRRGVYGHLFGFFGGIHLAVLSALICQWHPSASVNTLLSVFFQTYSQWPWPQPVILQGQKLPRKQPDSRMFMPIMMPCVPSGWCKSNISQSTFRKIISEFHRGWILTRNREVDWNSVFEEFPYSVKYSHFLQILLCAPTSDELVDWVGWMKSRIRSLLLKLEMIMGYCDPNPTEYVDHNVAEPNTVFYWGISPGSISIDTESLKEEFTKSIKTEFFNDTKLSQCTIELSVIGASQLPKSVQID